MAKDSDKPLVWLAGEIKSPPFSTAARIESGFLLRRLQKGDKLEAPHSKPMGSIGRRCHELRIRDEDLTWRIIYRVDVDAIILAEVFAKKSARTPKRVIESSRRRLKSYDEISRGD